MTIAARVRKVNAVTTEYLDDPNGLERDDLAERQYNRIITFSAPKGAGKA